VLTNVEGNPLFLEERLHSLLETTALVREQGTWRVRTRTGPQVPQVLERLVRSRVDRLSVAAREVVCPASVLGAEFPLSLLTAVCAAAGPVGPAVGELCARDHLQEVAGLPTSPRRARPSVPFTTSNWPAITPPTPSPTKRQFRCSKRSCRAFKNILLTV